MLLDSGRDRKMKALVALLARKEIVDGPEEFGKQV